MAKMPRNSFTAPNEDIVGADETLAETLIIGFDCEWFEPRGVPDDLDPELVHFLDDPMLTGDNVVLSYQVACLAPDGRTWKGIAYTSAGAALNPKIGGADDRAKYPVRWRFDFLLAEIISRGIQRGYLAQWPKNVIAAAHWTRADLSHMADFHDLKTHFDTVNKTYVTLTKPYPALFYIGHDRHELNVWLVDTMNLVPAGRGKSLDTVGKMHKFEKLDAGMMADGTPYKLHMDRLLQDDWRHFEKYAVRDAEICARHVEWMRDFALNELGMSALKRLPNTLSALAEKYALHFWGSEQMIEAVNGYHMSRETVYLNDLKKFVGKTVKVHKPGYEMNLRLATDCLHGGRNECFAYGPTAEDAGPWYEHDLASAYPTALSTLQIPDYDAARQTTDPADFRIDQLGGALVDFCFPAGTRFPCLPVEAPKGRGLVNPMRGTSYASSPEIVLALNLGADITIHYGYVIPWKPDSERPFKTVVDDLLARRNAAKEANDELQQLMFKQMSNSLYGKTCQGVSGATVFNTRDGKSTTIGPSKITNPFLATHITGLARACIGEMIAALPPHRSVLSVTTDSVITDAPLAEIDLSGPVCRHLVAAKEGATLLEQKIRVNRMLVIATRGIATLDNAGGRAKFARHGMHGPGGGDENEWMVRTMLNRTPETVWIDNGPAPFPTSYREERDMQFSDTEKRVVFEYDHKRRLVNPTARYVDLIEGDYVVDREHIAADSVPWNCLDEFNEERDQFKQWHRDHVLRTMEDWQNWREFRAGREASKAGVRRGPGGPVAQAKRLFIRAWVRGEWGLPGGAYRETAAALTEMGHDAKEQDFKNAARRYRRHPTPEHMIPADAVGVAELIAAVKAKWPEFDAGKLTESLNSVTPANRDTH
jgi:hypothetical protein